MLRELAEISFERARVMNCEVVLLVEKRSNSPLASGIGIKMSLVRPLKPCS